METSQDVQLYSSFADVVGIVFNNWTAIKLAAEHGMGGTPADTQRKLSAMIEVVTQTLASSGVDWYDISDLLAEAMDTEFSTILEDNSNDEVATHLCHLYQMFQTGDHGSLQAALASLPVHTPINMTLLRVQSSVARTQETSSSEDEGVGDDPPEDDGWTVVKRK